MLKKFKSQFHSLQQKWKKNQKNLPTFLLSPLFVRYRPRTKNSGGLPSLNETEKS